MLSKLKQFAAYAKRKPIEAIIPIVCFFAAFVHGSTKPDVPPPVVEEKGITITECAVNSQGLTVKWEAEDERIAGRTVFIIEARELPITLGKKVVFQPTNTKWYEIGRTTDFELSQPGVWTDKTREIRVRTVIEGSEE